MPASPLSRDTVLNLLSQIKMPGTEHSLAQSSYVKGLVIQPNAIGFTLDVPEDKIDIYQPIRDQAEQALLAHPDIEQASIVLTNHRATTAPETPPHASTPTSPLEKIDHIIAIASGKGGVGKSTTSVNLAMALQKQGYKVGLLDADIYGPSLPTMLGIKGKPEIRQKKIVPKQAHGLVCMSIGLLVPEDSAMIWRGPMVQGALMQLLQDVLWTEFSDTLDYLIIDLPPGTGDIQLSLAQKAQIDGAIIVSTPQDVALIDAKRAISMFQKVNIPILGLIENMSYFKCPDCGSVSHIFGHKGAEETAESDNIPFLGAIPLHLAIREHADSGMPLELSPTQQQHQAYYDKIADSLSKIFAKSLTGKIKTFFKIT